MTKAIEVALFLHLLGVAVWIGGMVFANFCLRPALGDLTPQMRLPLWESVFARFFNWVAASVLVILLTGGFLLTQYGGAHAAWPLHTMAGIGIVMMLLFGHIRVCRVSAHQARGAGAKLAGWCARRRDGAAACRRESCAGYRDGGRGGLVAGNLGGRRWC